jgi:hypothetical protein
MQHVISATLKSVILNRNYAAEPSSGGRGRPASRGLDLWTASGLSAAANPREPRANKRIPADWFTAQ